MFKKSGFLTFYAETPLHMGSGTALSYVDLPVQREKHTDFPIMQASGIKGVIKEFAKRQWGENNNKKIEVIFGPEEGDKFASCIVFADAKILLFPVRSVSGVFGWITCPFVLKRFKRDLGSAGIEFKNGEDKINIPGLVDEDEIIITSNSVLAVQSTNQVILEEFVFNIEQSGQEEASRIANKIEDYFPQNPFVEELPKRFAVVADDVFRDFVKLAVEIRTRIKIDQTTGTVETGALFTEELIPSESIFYSLVFFNDPYEKATNLQDAENVINEISGIFGNSPLLQLGGDETLGRGFLRVKFTPE